MKFLQRLRSAWRGLSGRVFPCDVGTRVGRSEFLARFLLDQHYRPLYRTVKPKAFEPPPDNELSVYRTLRLTEDGIWALGELHVARTRGKTLKGRATVMTQEVVNLRLDVVPDNKPCRHAFVGGWPREKSARMALAQHLAAVASFTPTPV